MRLLVDMGHPAHVHCANFVGVERQIRWRSIFKNAIREQKARGHEVKITARDKDVTLADLPN